MSLLLSGAKTMTFAGTEMQCLEIYTGEAYTITLQFTDAGGSPIDATGWTLDASAKFYTVDNVIYGELTPDIVTLGNITLDATQPSTGPGTYSADLVADWTDIATGSGYLYIPENLANGTGSPNPTPTPNLNDGIAVPDNVLVIVTVQVTRPSSVVTNPDDKQKEPLGFIVRYQ